MRNPTSRASAPGRAQPAYLRTGDFKPGHKKQGGRKRGTPNLFTSDYKKAILEAAYRVGYDGNGKDGVLGYLMWVGERHPRIFYVDLLVACLMHEAAEGDAPKEPHRTREEIDRAIRAYIGLDKAVRKRKARWRTRSPVGWTGQPMPVGGLMQLAVENPQGFCQLLIAAFLAKRRNGPKERKC